MSVFIRLTDYKSSEEKRQAFNDPENRYEVNSDDFKKIPGSPIAYWVSEKFFNLFENSISFESYATPRQGLGTTNNDLFTKSWFEVVSSQISYKCRNKEEALLSGAKWFPYSKGGGFRKWYGNDSDIVNWENDGESIKQYLVGKNPNIPRSESHYFKRGITWGLITSGSFSARYTPFGYIFDVGGSKAFPGESMEPYFLSLLNSKLAGVLLKVLNPTLNFQVGDLKKLPAKDVGHINSQICDDYTKILRYSRSDWNSFETSWDFEVLPVISGEHKDDTLEASYANWREFGKAQTAEMKRLEEENNRVFIDAYGLQDELTPDVPIEQITLTVNPAYRYKKKKKRAPTEDDRLETPEEVEEFETYTEEEYETFFRTDSMRELLSYSIGCMMGRYSLDEKGLIYAHSGNEGFDHSKYTMFPADEDGIIPLTDLEWFPDDATNRFIEFIEKVWGKDTKEQNLKFVAESLSPKRGETPEETIRRYMSANFFKDHMKRYKKRPIYWLFSSGKEKAFEALVYLHRYNESTLSRMRSEYVNPLQTNMNAYLTRLDKSLEDSSLSSSEQKKLEKEREVLIKKINELRTFDEQLKHYADQRISIDLDDGVKVNYGKFGDLLAEVKNITGGKDDD